MKPEANGKSLEILQRLRTASPEAHAEFMAEAERISVEEGIQAGLNYLSRAEVMLGLRRPRLAVYDHAFHLIGGAQKYGLTMTAALRDRFDITLIANKEIRLEDFKAWYGLDLSGCAVKIIRIPFYEEKGTAFLDPALVTAKVKNPFHLVSRASGDYDFFVNNSMNEMVFPLANITVLICHFPERLPQSYFYADRYSQVVNNSRYTASWVERMWKFKPHQHIYPPVDMDGAGAVGPKEKIILSVARFEPEGTKRQREMIEAFLKLDRLYPEIVKGWKFVLVGGSEPKNLYLDRLTRLIGENPRGNIELKVNIPAAELLGLYRSASIFWHLCGVVHDHPSEVEHFGMTTVEAMAHRAVPIVYDGGGLREIVDHGVDGFRVRHAGQMLGYSIRLFRNGELIRKLGEAAQAKAQDFSRARFDERVREFFDRLLREYTSP
jgi:glycosyltransferase involved in cell wall biosynthesis